jgi:single-strand DNA-binding protein
MPNFNKVTLMGNITRDIELRNLPGGQAIAQIGLAINRQWQGNDGQKKEEVAFVDCEAWGKQAETMHKYLGKGRPVFIEGRLKLDQWDDKENGQKRSKMKVVVESFQFIDSKPEGERDTQQQPAQKRAPRPTAPVQAAQEMNPDDIPFAPGDHLFA